MNRLFAFSRWLHKYVGLTLLLFLGWMSLSGVLMNHPDLISGVSVPGSLVPPQYRVDNWNRNSLIDLVFSSEDPQLAFAAGKQGVWKSVDGGTRFTAFREGLPRSAYYRKTRDLLLWEQDDMALLFAGTDGGLYVCDLRDERWKEVDLGPGHHPVKKTFVMGDRLLVATASGLFSSPAPPAAINFTHVPMPRAEQDRRVSLIEMFFALHSGEAWHLFGRLLFDLAGLILIFLCISAFYTWYFPWRRRHGTKTDLRTNPGSARMFKSLFKNHLKFGIWVAVVLLVIGGTGFFMRPPLLALIAEGSVPAGTYPGFLSDNPWHERIQNAMYEPVSKQVIVQASDGLWTTDAAFAQPWTRFERDVPIFVMGATVFEADGEGGQLVGSFAGLYHWQSSSEQSTDLMTAERVRGPAPLRPGDFMITSYFRTPQGEEFVATFEQGIVPIGEAKREDRFQVPQALTAEFRMPLWNYLFEIHNGRFFKDLVGGLYILIIPLGSLLLLLITLSGIYDWVFLKVRRRTSRQIDHDAPTSRA